MSQSISNTVLNYIADYFSTPVENVTPATVADDFAGWDSMANAEIILGLEDVLGYELEPEDLFELNNVGSLIDVFTKSASGRSE